MAGRQEIARARWQLWAITLGIMGALAGAIIILSTSNEDVSTPTFIPSRLLLAAGLAGMVGAFALYAIDRERHLHRLSERLVREQTESEQMAQRLSTLSELARERDTNAALLESSADGVAVVGADGAILRFNSALEDLTGVAAVEARGAAAAEILDLRPARGPLGEEADPVGAVLADGIPRSGLELRLVRRDGEERWVSLTASPVEDPIDGTPALVLVVLRDIAEQKEQEQMHRDFVSMAAHELRSPLTAIKGFARTLMLKWKALPEDRRTEYLSMVNDQSNRLARLVDDLMQVARIDAGRVVLEQADVDVHALARELVAQFHAQWAGRQVRVVSAGGSPVATADPHRLEEVLINLIDNAVKYSPDGAPVEVSIDVADEELLVSVRDRGVGIPPGEIPNLFQKFTRVPSAGTEDVPGTGLGLYIVRGLVEAHGGRVWVESHPGHGSTFRFTLPLASVPAATGTVGA